MSSKVSVKGLARDAVRADTRARKETAKTGEKVLGGVTQDSFVNFAQKLGIGAENALTSGTYGYNPITRNRTLLEWIHRGSWLGGVAVDIVADDMTRAGAEITCEMLPEDIGAVDREIKRLNIWPTANSCAKWARLYGGCIGVMLVDGQDMKTPLRVETVGKGQFKGILALDRWTVDPSLSDLVTEYGPYLGTPKYYAVGSNAPALRGQVVHYSRLAFRLLGVELPYQQALTENMWGISVLERLYDRMVAFDSASTGAAQLVFKSYLRTLKIEGLRDIVAAGGQMLTGLYSYVEIMRRYQGIEGITLLDLKDEFEVQGTQAFSGLDSVIDQLGRQLCGALQIPATRVFGDSPGGLGSKGEGEERQYFDRINQEQEKTLLLGTDTIYRLTAQSLGIKPPDDFGVEFRSLYELDDTEKAALADKVGTAVDRAQENGTIGRKTALKELRQQSKKSGVFTNITSEMIDAADDDVLPPMAENVLEQEHDLTMTQTQHELGQEAADAGHEREKEKMSLAQKAEADKAKPGTSKRKELKK